MTRQDCYRSFRQYCAALLGVLFALVGLITAPAYLHLPGTEASTGVLLASNHQTRAPQETAPTSFTQATPAQGNLTTLAAGKIIERQMAGGETHAFQVALAAGQYLQVITDQHGIDVELRIFDPSGQRLSEMDSLNGIHGLEIISAIAGPAGNYRVEIVSSNKGAQPGHYEVRLAVLRAPTEQDQEWIAAQRAYVEGWKLSAQSTAETQRQALRRFEDALGHWQSLGSQLMAAHTLHYLAESYRQIGQQQQALVCSEQALQLLRSLGERREEAKLLTTVGNINNELGEPRKALEYYDQALSFWREIKDTYNEARTLINIGAAYALLGEARKALENYSPALAVWQRLDNRRQAADTLNFIGKAYYSLDELQQSLEHYDQALKLYRALGNRSGEAELLNNLGIVYGKLGEAQKELAYYQQALALWRTTVNRRQEANTLTNLGLVEAQRNNSQKALANYAQALRLWRVASDRRGEAMTLQNLGDLQAAAADAKQALAYYDQALQLLQTAGDRWREARVLTSMGLLHTSSGAPQQALEYFNQALTICRAVGDRSGEAGALYGSARAALGLGQLALAREQIQAALVLIEAVRAKVGSQQLRASYLASVQKYYQLNIDVLMRLHRASPAAGFDALALQASERARARSLLEQLTEARADIRQGVEASLLERERQLAQLLNAKARRQLELIGQSGGAAQLTALKQEISQLEDEYNQVQTTIRQRSPHYAALTQPQPLSLRAIQAQLDTDSLLLEYSLGEERSFLWAVTKDSLKTYELPNREQIEQAARQVYALVTANAVAQRDELPSQRRARLARAAEQLPGAARQLSHLTLGPVAAELGNRRLVIIADGALQQTPFALLSEPGTTAQPLVVKHELISLPSASTLAVQRHELANRQPAPKLLAVLADPVFDRSDERAKLTPAPTAPSKQLTTLARSNARSIEHLAESGKQSVIGGRVRIPRLPFTRQEAERILALAPSPANLKAVGFQANRALALSAELGQYRYLHFATHGYLDSERPGFSALVLSLINERGEVEDGFLRAHEIYNLNLPAELVVLSACQTGLGKEIKGEGLVGLTRGFMYAGAARIVVSLWNVNDKATAELMTKFYQKMLKSGERPAAALRAAQVEMWRQKQWEVPYYWAAFVLQGEWK